MNVGEGVLGEAHPTTRAGVAGDDERTAGPSEPAVSVIMIFLNEVRFINEAIGSVLDQSQTTFELLLVDDGSTDGSAEIAKAHAERVPERIRYLTHADGCSRGTGPSRQVGLREARGRYVAFLDADDTYLTRRLERHVEILERRPDVDVVQSYHVNWTDWLPAGQRDGGDYLQGPVLPGDTVFAPPLALVSSLMQVDSCVGMNTITIRREAALRVGGFEIEFSSLYEDQAFLTKLYLEQTVYLLPVCLARYRMHQSSTVERAFAEAHDVRGDYQTATRQLASWQLRYVRSKGCIDPVIDNLLVQNVRASRAMALGWRGWRMYGTRAVRHLLARVLPDKTYSLLRHRRRALMNQRLVSRYLTVCRCHAEGEARNKAGVS